MKNLHRDQLDKLTTEKAELDIRISSLTQRADNEKREILARYFQDDFSENFKVRIGNEYVEINDFKNNSTILSLYTYTSWNDDNFRLHNSIELSMSSQRYEISNDIILREKRNVIDHYINIAVEYKEDILTDLNNCTSKYNKFIETFKTKRTELFKLIEAQRTVVDSLDKVNLLDNLLTKGINFNRSEFPIRTKLRVKFDHTLSHIVRIAASKVTASGKSADLLVTTHSTYDNIKHIHKVKGVRVSNVELFVNDFKDLIIK